VILPRFEIFQPETYAEACKIAEKNKGDAVFIAGGTDLMVNMKEKVIKPKVVISLDKVGGLTQIDYSEKAGLTLGSMVRIVDLLESPLVRDRFPLLAKAASTLGSSQVRSRATIGGNICSARPAGDTIGPLTAYGAEVQLVRGTESRWEPIAKFITGPGKTTRRDDEIMVAIRMKPFGTNSGVSYIKYGKRKAMEIAMLSVTVALDFDGNKCKSAAIALGAVGPTFLRCNEAEKSLLSQEITPQLAEKAAVLASAASTPRSSARASAEYRSELIRVLTRRAITEAASQHLK
jgi:CO/xanthine dehydrogenase FAD-binding subunit